MFVESHTQRQLFANLCFNNISFTEEVGARMARVHCNTMLFTDGNDKTLIMSRASANQDFTASKLLRESEDVSLKIVQLRALSEHNFWKCQLY